MKQVKVGSTDISIVIRIVDSTNGTPETGVTSATAGLAFNYRREGGLLVGIAPLSDLALLTSAHADGGLLHIAHGYYRLDVPDAAFAAGVDGVLVEGTATDMVVIGTYVQLLGYDPRTELTTAVLAVAGAAAAPGAEMALTAAYDAAKTAAQAGAQMDLVDAPNGTAITAIQSGLAIAEDIPTAQEIRDAMKLAPTVGAPGAGSVDEHLDNIPTTSAPAMITGQEVRDAMKLAPTGGAPAVGSVDAHLDSGAQAGEYTAALAAHDAKLDTVHTHVDSIIVTLAALPAAVWAATTRTLTSFGTALAGVAQAVWEYVKRELTQSPEDVAAAVSGTNLTIISAVTYDYTLTGLVIPADWKKIWVTLKTKRTDDDADSIVQIVESNPGVAADGLLYLNGASGTKAQASLTVNQVAGTIAIHIDDEATAELARWTGGYDVKVLDDAGDTKQIRSAKVSVVLTETKAIA
jgi:hypothetical protein